MPPNWLASQVAFDLKLPAIKLDRQLRIFLGFSITGEAPPIMENMRKMCSSLHHWSVSEFKKISLFQTLDRR